ncbi:MAG: Glutathione synthetase [Pseudomonadota bacterium]
MQIAFIVDPLHTLTAYKDSSVAMMREAARRGHAVFAILRDQLFWKDGATCAIAHQLEVCDDNTDWVREVGSAEYALTHFDAVLMRQDPPFDFEYITATWLLSRAEEAGARIINRPSAIRDHNEKLAITEFPQFIAPTQVSREMDALQAFIEMHQDCIVKPLDGMGGAQVFRITGSDPNRNVILETLTRGGTRSIMAQRFIPAISEGDKRILLINGEVVPHALARIPKAGETRGNLAAGGRGVVMPLTPRENEIAQFLAPILAARGLMIVGLDVIGGFLTEINVTSPTCFVEIGREAGYNVAARVIDALERI